MQCETEWTLAVLRNQIRQPGGFVSPAGVQ
jgi:hypothetical protein